MSVISMSGFRQVKNSDGMIKSRMDTLCLSRAGVEALILPPFQRPLRVNDKVKAIAEEMKLTGVIEGVITIGILNSKKYLVDGQHRKEAFLLSGMEEIYVDVRECEFETMAEMAAMFVKLNSSIVRMRPDDILRGLESSIRGLQIIRSECPFIGYDHIRRGTSAPLLSMSLVLRAWTAATSEIPSSTGKGGAQHMANNMTPERAVELSKYFNTAHAAWGGDPEYYRLWGELNVAICGWLWNRLVVHPESTKYKLTTDQFRKGLMGLSANGNYCDWLVGRNNSERDRAPAYSRIKTIMQGRVQSELDRKVFFPAPAWSYHLGGGKRTAKGI